MHAYILCADDQPIGYIQYYNKHDLSAGHNLSTLPKSCAGIDWYIGDINFIGKGLGAEALTLFLNQFVFKNFESAFVDPDTTNTRAIKVYEKVGFRPIKKVKDDRITWMLMEKKK